MLVGSPCASPRAQGTALMLLGVALVAPDSVLVRFLGEAGSPPWPIVAWKLFFSSITVSSYVIGAAGGPRKFLQKLCAGPWCLVALGTLLQAAQGVAFTMALFLTSSARALLFLCLNPFWSSLLGWLLLGEDIARQTVLALITAGIAICFIFAPDFVAGAPCESVESSVLGRASFLGDACAIASGIFLAAFITLCRHTGVHAPGVSLAPCVATGAAFAGLIALAFAEGKVFPHEFSLSCNTWLFYAAAFADGFGTGAFLVCISIAPALISGVEVGLICLLEMVVGPFYVFLAYGDAPAPLEMAGGVLLLLTVAIHEIVLQDAPPKVQGDEESPVEHNVSFDTSDTSSESEVGVECLTVVQSPIEAVFNYVPRSSGEARLSCVAVKKRVHNARLAGPWTLQRNGFTLVRHRTDVDFARLEDIKAVYYSEMEALVKAHIPSAERCIVFDHKVRRSQDTVPAPPSGFSAYSPDKAPLVNQARGHLGGRYGQTFGANHVVHGDYNQQDAEARIRALSQLPGHSAGTPPLSQDEAEEILRGGRRFMLVNVWRSISREHPIARNPMAMVDCASVNDARDLFTWVQRGPQDTGVFDGFSNGRIEEHVDHQIGLDPFSDHQWYYFPRMEFEEALVFKLYDSATSDVSLEGGELARFTMHSAFVDPSSRPEDPMRESIDTRILVIFPPAEECFDLSGL